MKQYNGFVTVGGLLVSALVGLGGFGSLAFVANIHQLLPNNTWTEVFREKEDTIAFLSERADHVVISDQIQASVDGIVQTFSPTPISVTLSPTPNLASPTMTPTPIPASAESDDDGVDDDKDDNVDDQSKIKEKEQERKHKNREKESLRINVQSDAEVSTDWWLKYKLMVFGKTN